MSSLLPTGWGVHNFTLLTFLILLINSLRIKNNFFIIKVRYTPWLIGTQISVLRNQPFAAESLFRKTCLVYTKGSKIDETTKTFKNVCLLVELVQNLSIRVIKNCIFEKELKNYVKCAWVIFIDFCKFLEIHKFGVTWIWYI